ncbi:hypothetical protein VNI00_008784 [Paramarasmius palmivorus]|uniref:Peroxidase n=1 Tax=Paramarasmius palmivorus TaxID=297713 RepID=A0AAW0CW39_9AGAR
MILLYPTLLLTLIPTYTSAVYTYPNPTYEFSDKVLYHDSFLPDIVKSCAQRDHTTVSAQWIRLAYHDMATYDADKKEGGLDASIVYELDREQNKGVAMSHSVTDLVFFTSPATSLADTIAMGTVLAVASCGGPVIPFRAGRIDATQGGPETVPEPQESLEAHEANFKRQGFSREEMIGLVACGHSLGGVTRADFPDIVQDQSVEFQDFSETKTNFDNRVITDYLAGNTENPLVVGPNSTTNSDLRIFSADGNVTMQALSSVDTFASTCVTLYEKMLNSVPSTVTLSDPITPIEYKILNPRVYPSKDNDSTLTFSVGLRMLTQSNTRNVTLFWTDRRNSRTAESVVPCSQNSPCKKTFTRARPTTSTALASKLGKGNMVIYTFSVMLDPRASISKFWFEVDENGDGKNVTRVANGGDDGVSGKGGDGYEVDQDVVLFDPSRSSLSFGGSSRRREIPLNRRGGGVGGPAPTLTYHVVVAASARGSNMTSNITAVTYEPGNGNGPETHLPKIKTTTLQPDDSTYPPKAGYRFYSGVVEYGNASLTHIDIMGERCGKTWKQTFIDAQDLST